MKGLEELQPAWAMPGFASGSSSFIPGDARLQKQPWGWAPLLGKLLELG